MNRSAPPIPIGRVLERLDSYLDRKDYASAERHLKYWFTEAEAALDTPGRLTVLSEQIGLYRKTEQKEKCLSAIASALELLESFNVKGSVLYATVLLNAATGYKACGKNEDAVVLYRKAKQLYEANPDIDTGKLGALYNNMAVALADAGSYSEAEDLYMKALDIMTQMDNGALEAAMTYLNLADLLAAESGTEAAESKISEYLGKAEELILNGNAERNGYFAFVCEKCAPSFDYYGYFITADELRKAAEDIYERS